MLCVCFCFCFETHCIASYIKVCFKDLHWTSRRTCSCGCELVWIQNIKGHSIFVSVHKHRRQEKGCSISYWIRVDQEGQIMWSWHFDWHYKADLFFTRLCCAQHGQKKELPQGSLFKEVRKPTSTYDICRFFFAQTIGKCMWIASRAAGFFFCPCHTHNSLVKKNNTGLYDTGFIRLYTGAIEEYSNRPDWITRGLINSGHRKYLM